MGDFCEPKTAKEKSSIIQIDNYTRELLEGLRSIERSSGNINKRLLTPLEKIEANEGKDEQVPNGWFEEHLAALKIATRKVVKIIENLDRLSWATKPEEKVGQ